MPADQSYKVGYGRPPKDTQFKKGQSGNRKGRARDSKNFSRMLTNALNRRVSLTLNGKTMRITVRDALAFQLVSAAASGDSRLIQLLLQNDYLEKTAPLIISLPESCRNL